jgi:cell division protein FtsI/penicillin-binding protein 2
MVRALSSIANGGYLITPYIASEINYNIGGGKTIAPSAGPRVFSTTTSAIVTNMLVNVFDQVMAPANAGISKPGYSIAAKTGTAQIADLVNGGYYADRYLHSFFGFFPAHNPRFLVFLYQVYPKNVEYASQTLIDPFAKIASYLIGYYDIAPDR